jgi:hypothetical protein
MSKNERSDKQSPGVVSVRRGAALLLALSLVTGTALATVTLSRLASSGAVNPSATSAPTSPAVKGGVYAPSLNVAALQEDDELHVELSTAGFAPAEVNHAAGPFAISVDNLDVADEYVLQLKGQGGTLINEVRVQKGSAGWTVDLPAGTYTLMVANHPDWVCQIVTQ